MCKIFFILHLLKLDVEFIKISAACLHNVLKINYKSFYQRPGVPEVGEGQIVPFEIRNA